MELLLDGLGCSRRIGDEDDRSPFPPPLQQALGGTRVQMHAVVNDAPDVAQDQPVARVQR